MSKRPGFANPCVPMVFNGPEVGHGMDVMLPNVLAVVPAKLTSVRIPRKNLEKILGLELFLYSARAAQLADGVGRVVVSSESLEVLDIAAREGIEGIQRPPELSGESVTNQAVLLHAVGHMQREFGWRADIVVLLQPTHPFRVPADIDRAIEILRSDPEATSVFALRPDKTLQGRLEGTHFIPDVPLSVGRSERPAKYVNTGAFYVLKVTNTLMAGAFFGQKILGCLLSRPELEIDIDEPDDLMMARAMAERYRKDLGALGLLEEPV